MTDDDLVAEARKKMGSVGADTPSRSEMAVWLRAALRLLAIHGAGSSDAARGCAVTDDDRKWVAYVRSIADGSRPGEIDEDTRAILRALDAAEKRADEAVAYTEQLKERIRVGNEIRSREADTLISRAELAEKCLVDRCENRMDGEDALESAKVCAYVSALHAVVGLSHDWQAVAKALRDANIDEETVREAGALECDIETVRRALREG